MTGTSIEQARAALLLALSRLTPRDRFNVIQFNSVTDKLFDGAVAASPEAIQTAQKYVRALKAGGGTEMAPALDAALAASEDSSRLRQVIFLTDGSVGNEEALFQLIHQRLGRSRLFTVGIGSAPNSHFMSQAAEFGHGTFTYIGDVAEVGEKMSGLFSKLESPALTDIEIKWPSSPTVVMWPARVPDLYQGEPIVVSAALDALGGKAVVTGKRGGQPWEVTLSLGGGRAESGVNVLWARKKIASLMSSVHEGGDPGEVRLAVIETALEHHLVGKYTSLVAVDVTPSKPADADSASAALPVNLPEGWNYESVFGSLPQTATPASLHLLLGLASMILAAALFGLQRRKLIAAGTWA
jgi:Ca-activated chloride channel family protein